MEGFLIAGNHSIFPLVPGEDITAGITQPTMASRTKMEVDLDDGGSTPEDVMDLDTAAVRKEPWSFYLFF